VSTSSEAVPDKAPMKKAPVTVETRKQSVDMQKKADEIDRRAWCTASSTRRGVWGTLSSPPAETVSKSAESSETASQILICVSLSDDTLGPKSMLFQKFVVHTRMLGRRPSCLSACRNMPGDLRLVLPRALNDMLALGALWSVSLIARAGSLSIALLVPEDLRTDSRVPSVKIPFKSIHAAVTMLDGVGDRHATD